MVALVNPRSLVLVQITRRDGLASSARTIVSVTRYTVFRREPGIVALDMPDHPTLPIRRRPTPQPSRP
jgi:hypothetical protein